MHLKTDQQIQIFIHQLRVFANCLHSASVPTAANCWCGKKYSMEKVKLLSWIRPAWKIPDRFSSARKEPRKADLVSRSLSGILCFSTKEHRIGEDRMATESFNKSKLLATARHDLPLLISGSYLAACFPQALAWLFPQMYHTYYYLRPVQWPLPLPEMYFSHIFGWLVASSILNCRSKTLTLEITPPHLGITLLHFIVYWTQLD